MIITFVFSIGGRGFVRPLTYSRDARLIYSMPFDSSIRGVAIIHRELYVVIDRGIGLRAGGVYIFDVDTLDFKANYHTGRANKSFRLHRK